MPRVSDLACFVVVLLFLKVCISRMICQGFAKSPDLPRTACQGSSALHRGRRKQVGIVNTIIIVICRVRSKSLEHTRCGAARPQGERVRSYLSSLPSPHTLPLLCIPYYTEYVYRDINAHADDAIVQHTSRQGFGLKHLFCQLGLVMMPRD